MPVQRCALIQHAQPQRRQAELGCHQLGSRPGGRSGALLHGSGSSASCQEAEEQGAGHGDHEQPLQE